MKLGHTDPPWRASRTGTGRTRRGRHHRRGPAVGAPRQRRAHAEHRGQLARQVARLRVQGALRAHDARRDQGAARGDLAEDDAHLYLWTTNGFLRDGYDVVEAWGFKPSTLLTWCKAPMGIGLGGAYTITTEFVIYARRGSLKPLRALGLDVVPLQAAVQPQRRPAHSRQARGLPRRRRAGLARSLRRAVRPPRPLRLGLLGRRVPRHRRDGLFDYGLRKGALQKVRFRDFDHVRKRLTIFTKGEKVRVLPLPDPAFWDDLGGSSSTSKPSPTTT
jgi:hypothetical protein